MESGYQLRGFSCIEKESTAGIPEKIVHLFTTWNFWSKWTYEMHFCTANVLRNPIGLEPLKNMCNQELFVCIVINIAHTSC